MALIRSEAQHNSGIPLGGIGTGSVEIRPDGYFHEWHIFNLGGWAPRQPECCKTEPPGMPPGALCLYAWARAQGEAPVMRRLGIRTDQHNLYSFAWLKSVESIDFDGRYPVAKLTYHGDDLPVAITAEMCSPFIPHDARASGTPGCHMVFTVRNLRDKPVEVALLATLQNPLASGEKDRMLENSVARSGETTFLTMRTKANPEFKAAIGSLGLSVTGGSTSWVSGEYNAFFSCYNLWQSAFGVSSESLLHDFRASGRLPSLPSNRPPSGMLRMTDKEIEALSSAKLERLARETRRLPFANMLARRISDVDLKLLKNRAGLITFLKDIRARLNNIAGEDRSRQNWGTVALASRRTLRPQESGEISYTLGWHFPWHYSRKGNVIGHMYSNWFKDAEEVNRFLVKNRGPHLAATRDFARTLFDTTLDSEMADAWSAQLTTIPKCSWWVKNGDFGVWEGLGCCGFHTTDITYQGSFNLLALFPEIEKRQIEMGARFQRADGRVHHFFIPDLSAVDNGFDRVDMNQQFVLLACRDYMWTNDKGYLRRLWPHILSAMKNTAELDRDGDGLPDHDTRRNTYDVWNFFGTPSYVASLWISALVAASRMADDLGHRKEAAQWRKTLKKAAASFERKLWNGEYYSLWVDGKVRDECCMTDQIDGEWFTQLIGLGHVLPEQRIRAALKAVMKYNYTSENGLQNADYPKGVPKRIQTHRNLQQTAPWTGIEYAIASMMMDFGMFAEGLKVVKNIHERHARAGRFWNHVECGDHYYRAMSSWAILLGATGFKVDAPRGSVSFAPAVEQPEFRAPWVSATGWGSFATTAGSFELSCASGTLSFRELRIGGPSLRGTVSVNGRTVQASARKDGTATVVTFGRGITLRAGDKLSIG